MHAVRVQIRKYVDDSQPGWVECILVDAQGREWVFVEKVPVVTEADLDAGSDYPQPGLIACEIVERRRDEAERELVSIDTERPWHIEAVMGESRFEVLAEQMTELE